MVGLCSNDQCDVMMISVLDLETSRISILRSEACVTDYEVHVTTQRAEVIWTFHKLGSAMEVKLEDEVVATLEFRNSISEECRSWPELYTWMFFNELDTASIAYCTMLHGMKNYISLLHKKQL